MNLLFECFVVVGLLWEGCRGIFVGGKICVGDVLWELFYICGGGGHDRYVEEMFARCQSKHLWKTLSLFDILICPRNARNTENIAKVKSCYF